MKGLKYQARYRPQQQVTELSTGTVSAGGDQVFRDIGVGERVFHVEARIRSFTVFYSYDKPCPPRKPRLTPYPLRAQIRVFQALLFLITFPCNHFICK
jgi:hypothetical protein